MTGRVIDNPVTGERIVIQTTAAQTDGRYMTFDVFLPPGGHVPARHVHPIQHERFTVIEGRLRFQVGRRSVLANAGETVLVPPGTAHWFGNAGASVALARVTVQPALRMEELLERTGALAVEHPLPGVRLPRLSDLALVLLEFQREIAVPNVPASLLRVVLGPIAWLGRRRRDGP